MIFVGRVAGADTVEPSMCPNGGHVTVFVDECNPAVPLFISFEWIEGEQAIYAHFKVCTR